MADRPSNNLGDQISRRLLDGDRQPRAARPARAPASVPPEIRTREGNANLGSQAAVQVLARSCERARSGIRITARERRIPSVTTAADLKPEQQLDGECARPLAAFKTVSKS